MVSPIVTTTPTKTIILEDEVKWQNNISDPLKKTHPELEIASVKTLEDFEKEIYLHLNHVLYLFVDLRVPKNSGALNEETIVDDVLNWFEFKYPSLLSTYIEIHQDIPRVVVVSGELNLERRHQLIRYGIHGNYVIYKNLWSDRFKDVLEYLHDERVIVQKSTNLCDIELFIDKHSFPIEDSIIRTKANMPLRATVVLRATSNLLPEHKLIGEVVNVGLYCDGAVLQTDDDYQYDLSLHNQHQVSHKIHRNLVIRPPYLCDATTFEILWNFDEVVTHKLGNQRELTIFVTLKGRLLHLFKLPIQLIGSELLGESYFTFE